MKRIVTLLLTVVLLSALSLSVFAFDPYTADTFVATEGYKVYSIFGNENVKFFAKDPETGLVREYSNARLTADGFIHNDLQFFQGGWYMYDGASLALLNTGDTYIEITFHGTAFNLGLCIYRGAASAINMDAKITVDETEYDLPTGALVCPDGDDINARNHPFRYFQVTDLEDGWHTVRIVSTGTERLAVEYYEIIETEPKPETQAPVTQAPVTSDDITVPPQGDSVAAVVFLTAALIGTSAIVIGKKRK